MPLYSDDETAAFVNDLKSRQGRDVHRSGRARLAQTPGPRWFDQLKQQRRVELLSATTYSSGLVVLYYQLGEL